MRLIVRTMVSQRMALRGSSDYPIARRATPAMLVAYVADRGIRAAEERHTHNHIYFY